MNNEQIRALVAQLLKLAREWPKRGEACARGAVELERQAAKANHFEDEWSDVCNENQVLLNAISAALRDLQNVRDITYVMSARAALESAVRLTSQTKVEPT